MRNRSVLYRFLILAAVGLFVACDGKNRTVTQPSQVASIQVIGPETMDAGRIVQYGVTITYVDGTTRTGTSMPNLIWRSSNPSVLSVSNSGLVTAMVSGSGEVVITAEMTTDGIQGTQKVMVWGQSKAAVTAELEVSEREAAGQITYDFVLKLTESAGVSATITGVSILFDNYWGGECTWTPDKLDQSRISANGTLSLGPLTCDDGGKAFNVDVSIGLKDDNNHSTDVSVHRELQAAVNARLSALGRRGGR